MRFVEILLLAVGLAMDATAISAAKGLALRRITLRHVALVVAFFGGSQALMPLVGWGLGAAVGGLVRAWSHWVVFAIFAVIGGKMLWEARAEKDDEDPSSRELFGLRVMFVLAIATSVDALAAGVSLSLVRAPLALSVVTIGLVTGAMSAAALWLGRRFGAALGRRLDVIGGLVLVGLGVKVLVEHYAR